MPFFAMNSRVDLLIINIALSSFVLGLITVLVGRWFRHWTLPARHGLYCIALVLMLISPLAIWGSASQGLGVVLIPVGSFDSEASHISDSSLSLDQAVHQQTVPNRISESDTTTTEDTAAVQNRTKAAVLGGEPSGERRTSAEMILWTGSVLALIWGLVSFLFLAKLARGLYLIRRLRCSLHLTTDPRVIQAMHQANPETGQRKIIPVYESPVVPAPLTLGLWRSVIVIPEGLTESLNESELACVLAHEVAHVTRHDTFIAILQQLAGIGFWWNPLLRIINRQISQLRERICDDYVVQRWGDGLPLAEAIVKVAEWSVTRGVPVPLTITLVDDAGEIEQRITRLMKSDRKLSVKLNLKSIALIGLVGIMLAVIPLVPAVRAPAAPITVTPENAAPQSVAADAEEKDWRVQIRVVDAEGKPIPNPQIGVQWGGRNELVWQTGDQEGSITTTLPTRSPNYCNLFARASGYAPMRAFWGRNQDYAADPLPAEFTFQMTKAITVGGTVVDGDNQPVANARVLFSASSKKTDATQRAETSLYEEACVTDEQGHWRCDLAPSTINSAAINVTHPDYISLSNSYGQSWRVPELRNLTHSWTLKKGFDITGLVVDTNGTPIEGAMLTLGELNSSSQDGPFARTDAEGRYRFEKVSTIFEHRNTDQTNLFTIMILKRGYMPAFQSVPGYGKRPLNASTEQKRIVDFTLKRGVKLTLHVVDSQDRPVEGAWVMINHWHVMTTLRVLQKYGVSMETDAQGNWVWENAPPGERISYDVGKGGFADVRNLEITVNGAETEKTVTLKQPQFITGKVIDAKTRQPIANFVVERAFEDVGGHPDGLYWTNDLTRGKNGTYQKRVTMPPHNGHYKYRARAEGYETAVSKSTPFKEGKTTVNFELQLKPQAPGSEL